MPVQLQPYQSMYVDFKSPEISAALNARYLRNYTAQDKLQESLTQLKAAPFEGDMKLRQQLIENTQKQLTQLSERGDYENLTVPIMQTAKKFTASATPLMQNYQAFQTYAESLKEAYKEEKLDYEDYMGTLLLAKSRYSGLTLDENGNATNLFTGIDPVYNPDIQGRMHDALNGIVAEEFGMDAKIVGMDTTAGTIQVMKEGKIKTVSSKRVSSVMDMVMSDPQVRSYLDRKGTIRAANMSEDDLGTLKSTRLKQINSEVSRLQKELSKADSDEERSNIESYIGNLLTNAGTIESMQTPEQLRAWAATENAAQMEQTYRNAAQSRYGYYSQTVDTQIGPEWLQTIAGNGGLGASSIYTGVTGTITEVTNPEGNTTAALTSSIQGYATTLNQFEDPKYMEDKYGLPLTGSEILNMSEADFMKNFPQFGSSTAFTKAKSAIQTAKAMKMATEKRLSEVRNTLNISSEEEISDIKSNVQGADAALAAIMSGMNVSEAEALDLFMGYVATKQDIAARSIPGSQNTPEFDGALDGPTLLQMEKIFGATKGMFNESNGSIAGRNVNSIYRDVKTSRQANLDAIDNYLEENSATTASMPVFNTIPFYMSKKEKSDFDEMFSSGNSAIGGSVYLDGKGQSVSFELAVQDMAELQPKSEGFDVGSAKLASYTFAPYNLSGTGGTMQLDYVDKDDKRVTVAMPMSQIDNPAINRFEASPFAKFATIVGAQRARQVENIVVPVYDANNNRFEIQIKMQDASGASTAKILYPNGDLYKQYAFEDMLKQDGPLAALIANGGRIEYL